jgi:hypothetical protein
LTTNITQKNLNKNINSTNPLVLEYQMPEQYIEPNPEFKEIIENVDNIVIPRPNKIKKKIKKFFNKPVIKPEVPEIIPEIKKETPEEKAVIPEPEKEIVVPEKIKLHQITFISQDTIIGEIISEDDEKYVIKVDGENQIYKKELVQQIEEITK